MSTRSLGLLVSVCNLPGVTPRRAPKRDRHVNAKVARETIGPGYLDPKYAKHLPFGLCLEDLGCCFTYFWAPGMEP